MPYAPMTDSRDMRLTIKDRCRPSPDCTAVLVQRRNLMQSQILRPDDSSRKVIVVIIILAWLIITIRSSSPWLTPIDITFFALLVGQPEPQLRDGRSVQSCAEPAW